MMDRFVSRLLLATLLAWGLDFGRLVTAQEPADAMEEDEEESSADVQEPVPPAGPMLPGIMPGVMPPMNVVPPGEELVGLKYEEIEASEMLKYYSDKTGLALMKDPSAVTTVKITIKCPKKIPLKEALLAIEGVLAMNGIGLVPMGDKFLKVVPIATARTAGMATGMGAPDKEFSDSDHLVSRIIELKHIEVAEAQAMIGNLKHAYGSVIPMERVNCIMVTDTTLSIKRMLEVLEYLDQPVESREEMKIVPIVYAKASEIQGKLEAIIADAQAQDSKSKFLQRQLTPPRPTTPSAPTMPGMPSPTPSSATDISASATERGIVRGRVKIVADDRTNALIIITRPDQFAVLENIIKALDQQVDPDVSIKVFALEFASAKDIVGVLNNIVSGSAKGSAPGAGKAPTIPTPIPMPDTGKKETTAPAPSSGDLAVSGRLSSEVKIFSDERTNSLLIMASKADMALIEGVLKQLDI
ncbi:MAG: hypothetical protein HY343_01565, partial [Lentisphaerae bacterium]|nr:hypothetical protein [Lentisphaerota bacterium]